MATEQHDVESLPRPFRHMAWSNLAAQLAEQVGLAAAPLVAVLSWGAGVGETGLLQMAQTLPFLLLSAPAGVLADRTSRRGLIVVAEAVRAISLLCVLALLVTGTLSLTALLLLGFIGATGTAVYNVAGPALVPALVRRSELARANGMLELARSTAFAAGPALAGALVSWTGAKPAYALAACSSIFAVLILRSVSEPARTPSPRRNPLQDLYDGARFVVNNALLRPILLTAIFFNVGWFVIQAAYVPYAVRVLHMTASEVGFSMGVYGFGMITGALAAPRLAGRLRFGLMIAFGPACGLLGALLMALTVWVQSPWIAGFAFFLFGSGPIVWVISSTTLRQAITPENLLGRASALVMMATFGARPVGAGIGALIGARWGEESCMLLAAASFLVQFAVIGLSQAARLRQLPQEVVASPAAPSAPGAAPARVVGRAI